MLEEAVSGVDRADSGEVSARVVVRGSDGRTRIVADEVGELPAGVEYGPSDCACRAEFCDHERTATPRRGVDRAALIEEIMDAAECGPTRAALVLDAVLPLIAQAIEDEATRIAERVHESRADLGRQLVSQFVSELDGRILSARLVRSLAEEGQPK